MNKEQLQELREKIIHLNHPECETVEEAFEEEKRDFLLYIEEKFMAETYDNIRVTVTPRRFESEFYPITIGRVLFAFVQHFSKNPFFNEAGLEYYQKKTLDMWLLHSAGIEATLEDQSQYTQEKIYDLFCK